jgi:tetratricopeptide (TPR) repeat protein
MANIENIKVLADAAYQGKNFEQAYSYYSQVLESEIDNSVAWVRKGVSASHLSNTDAARVNEAKLLVEKGRALGIDANESRMAAEYLREAYESLFTRQQKSLLDNVKDQQKVAMPQGGSILLHMFGQALNKTVALQSLATPFLKSHELLLLVCELDSSEKNLKFACDSISRLVDHSIQSANYLEEHGDKDLLTKLREANTRFGGLVSVTPPALTQASAQSQSPTAGMKNVGEKTSTGVGSFLRAVVLSFIASFFLSAVLSGIGNAAIPSEHAFYVTMFAGIGFWICWPVLFFVFLRRRNNS